MAQQHTDMFARVSLRHSAVPHAPIQEPDQGELVVMASNVSIARPRVGSSRPLHVPEWLLGQGTWPAVFGADLAALVASAIMMSSFTLEAIFVSGSLIAFYRVLGLYRSRLAISVLDDLPRLLAGALGATSIAAVADTLVGWAGPGGEVFEYRLLLFAGLSTTFVVLARAAAYALVRGLRAAGIAHRTLVLGAGRVGGLVAFTLQEHPEYGLEPVGFVDSDPLLTFAEDDLPVFGGQRDLADVLQRQQIRAVVVAFSSSREEHMIDIIRECDRMHCEIFVVPRLFELHHVSDDMDYTWGVPLVRLRRGTYRNGTWRVKRMADVVLAGAALVVLAPLMAAVALAVRAEGGRGVLFRQERLGVDQRHFDLLKFRSMRPVDDTESATYWNISADDRIGPVGRFLRKSSIDELPQLINIMRGDMSLVGPRPERPHFAREFADRYPRYVARHRVPCGLTGWAQIHGLRGDTSIEDRARFDNYYVENWSLWLDVKIILRTVTSVITRAGS